MQSGDLVDAEAGGTGPAPQFGWTDEFLVVMGAARQQAQHIFSPDNSEQPGLGVAVERREEHAAARLHEAVAGGDDSTRIGHMFQHFEASHGIKAFRLFGGQGFDRNLAVVEVAHALLFGMQASDGQRGLAHVDAEHAGATSRHAFRQDASAAADIHDALAGEADTLVDPVQAQGVNVMQGLEFGGLVPPFGGQGFELGDFGRIDVGAGMAGRAGDELNSRWVQWLRHGGFLGPGWQRATV